MIKCISHQNTANYFSTLLLVSSFSLTGSSFAFEPLILESASSNPHSITPYQHIFNAAIQGDAKTIKIGLAKTAEQYNFSDNERAKLSIMLALINENEDKTEQLLTQFTTDNNDNAQALIFAAIMWQRLSKKMGIFSYYKTYKKGLNAYIRAFENEADNDLYRSLAGSAYTMLDSDNKEKQRELLTGYRDKDKGFHLVASMDMAQNDRDEQLLLTFAEKAMNAHNNNMLVIEQAGQAFWTAGNVDKAQQAFQKACLLPAPTNIFRYTWQDSCYLAGQLALNDTNEYKKGNEALAHLLTINGLDTSFNQEIREMKSELDKKLTE